MHDAVSALQTTIISVLSMALRCLPSRTRYGGGIAYEPRQRGVWRDHAFKYRAQQEGPGSRRPATL